MKQATSLKAVIIYLAVHCIGRGGCRYWTSIDLRPKNRSGKREVDYAKSAERLARKYQTTLSRSQRCRRKRAGLSTVRGIRYRNVCYLLATEPKGGHRIFQDETLLDLRKYPIHIGDQSVACRRGDDGKYHGSVWIRDERYRELEAEFLDLASKTRRPEPIEEKFSSLRILRFKPVQWQLSLLLMAVNGERRRQGLQGVDMSCLQKGVKSVKIFADEDAEAAVPVASNHGGDP